MKYYFPIHLNGGNRGCEAIAKGTAMILQEKKENLVGLCTDVGVDMRLGVDKYVTLLPAWKPDYLFRFWSKVNRILRNETDRNRMLYKHIYRPFIDRMDHNDILVSTGGDMMCYGNNEVNYTVNLAAERGIKSILWGCSIGEENLTKEKLEALHKFSLIYAREPLTKAMLEKHGIGNVVVSPDPAFILEPETCDLPECFSQKEVIGINLSNFVRKGYALETVFFQEIFELIKFILAKMDCHILLIPHVMWEGQDDRVVCKKIKDEFPTSRVSILDSEMLNYCQFRYIISKCKIFIGARTHSVISAYSTSIPTLALGYSIKAKGIAKAVGMPDWSVVDSRNADRGILLSAFKRLLDEENAIRKMLENNIPAYKSQLLLLREYMKPFVKKEISTH